MPCPAQDRHCLDVAEAFFDPLADALTDRVTGMAGSAAVDRGLACFAGLCEVRIDGDMRSYVAFPEFADRIGDTRTVNDLIATAKHVIDQTKAA